MTGSSSGAQHGDFEAFEEKMDELNDGLLSAYAAGFQKALEVYDIHPDMETDLESLKSHQGLSEDHYYFWDGRTKPLELWIREQFALDAESVQKDDREDGGAERDWVCGNCGYHPRLVHVDEPVDTCSICGEDEWEEDTEGDQR